MTEKKTAEEFLKKNASFQFEEWKRDCPGGYKLLMRAMKEHTAQELDAYKARLKELLVDRINKSEQERRECTPGSDAYILMLGHKYEATKLLDLIDKL